MPRELLVGALLGLLCGSAVNESARASEGSADSNGGARVSPLLYYPPSDSDGGWRTLPSADEARRGASVDTAQLDRAFELIQQETKHGGLLVVRHGWLVYERYFGAAHRNATPNLASCGKSFTSVAVGMLMAERHELFRDGLDTRVFASDAYFPAAAFPLSDPRKADIKLGQLLAFTAGIRGNNPVFVDGREQSIDPAGPDGWQASVDAVAFGREDAVTGGQRFSATTLWRQPGQGYSYASSSIHMASTIVRHVSGEELETYLDARLARPLGWGAWGYGHQDRQLAHTPGGGGITLRATDMMRFLYLMLRHGRWRDEQLIPADYVRHCSQSSPYNVHYPYSLQFDVNTGGHVAGAPRDAYWKTGSGGHAMYVIPSLDMVVWKLGGRDDQYSQPNTGRPQTAAAIAAAKARDGFRATVDKLDAVHEVLRLAVAAAVEPGNAVSSNEAASNEAAAAPDELSADRVDYAHPVYATQFDGDAALADWRLEGGKRMAVEDGCLVLESEVQASDNSNTADADHLVAWLTREMPADFLLEFSFCPDDRQKGLSIVFFNARGRGGESIFDASLAKRDGLFKQYHSGDLDNYHISYWAGDRGTAHIRKNFGFHLVKQGDDLVRTGEQGALQTVHVCKKGGAIRVFVDRKLAIAWDDDGRTYGPVHDHAGWIGLRQMAHTHRARYGHLAVYPLK